MEQTIRVLFYLLPYSGIPSNTPYQHTSIALAEGFCELGIEFYGSCKYWFDWEKREFLFRVPPKGYKADIQIYSTAYINKFGPNKICKDGFNILLDDADGMGTPAQNAEFKHFDLILRSHFNSGFDYLNNVRPWAFGLTNRLIFYNNIFKHLPVKHNVFSNIRVPQNIRVLANQRLLPKLMIKYQHDDTVTDSLSTKRIDGLEEYSYWNQTGRRHNKEYFKILNSSLLTFAFGGLSERKIGKKGSLAIEVSNKIMAKLNKLLKLRQKPFYYIHNFDNWRFWEALASNSCPLAMNFEYWDCIYPEMPQCGKHYLGVKDHFFENAAESILQMNEGEINKIAEAGRAWVLENYSPIPTAKRLLNLVEVQYYDY